MQWRSPLLFTAGFPWGWCVCSCSWRPDSVASAPWAAALHVALLAGTVGCWSYGHLACFLPLQGWDSCFTDSQAACPGLGGD